MKTVVVVGVGALGSHVVQLLRNCDCTIRVVDFDRVEQRNVMSQFHSKPNVGKGKVQSLAQAMAFLFGRKIEQIPHKLVENNAKEILGGADLLIDCLDNGDARRVVQAFARANAIACLHGALSADGTFGTSLWDRHFVIDEATGNGKTCENGDHLPFIALVSAHIAFAAQAFLKRGETPGCLITPSGVQKIS